ncbi:hypothetical protein [Mesorhizobium sp. dw_380]|uniref:hypothetical protein n=1 Tax=Mesorhizobium sp. dw_380 TaxID=2812001 RepID=UPI001BDE8C95|nr:hypothetical protein [Mesorhizobium sp. dw_380]
MADQGCITAIQAPQRPSEARAFRLEAQDRKFEKLPGTPGKLNAALDNKGHGYCSERPRWNGECRRQKQLKNRAVGGYVVGTKKEKQNFRVRFLHTLFLKYLILFTYLSSPSLPRFVIFDRSGIDCGLLTLNVADSKRTLPQ